MLNNTTDYNNVRAKRKIFVIFGSPAQHRGARDLSVDKTVRRVTDAEQQQAETYRYWQSLSVGERLSAVWDISAAAYGFAAAFKGTPPNDARRPQRTITRVQRSRS